MAPRCAVGLTSVARVIHYRADPPCRGLPHQETLKPITLTTHVLPTRAPLLAPLSKKYTYWLGL